MISFWIDSFENSGTQTKTAFICVLRGLFHQQKRKVSPVQYEQLRGVKAVLFDMDGVVYVGNRPLPGVQEILNYLDETGRGWLFITNNASNTSAMFAEKLAKMDIAVDPAHILGSAAATAAWLGEQEPAKGKVIMLGMEGLRTALLDEGFTLVDDPFEAEFAVAGINFNLVYEEAKNITLAVRNGARFVGTNIDPTYPTEQGQIPGTGSIIAMLEAATGQKAEIVGKPYPGMYELAMHRLNAEIPTTLMVGDRYETDIAGAAKLGLVTAGVLTGISKRADYEQADPPPTYIVEGLPALLEAFKAADAA